MDETCLMWFCVIFTLSRTFCITETHKKRFLCFLPSVDSSPLLGAVKDISFPSDSNATNCLFNNGFALKMAPSPESY